MFGLGSISDRDHKEGKLSQVDELTLCPERAEQWACLEERCSETGPQQTPEEPFLSLLDEAVGVWTFAFRCWALSGSLD